MRYYDPTTGVWICKDPKNQGWNPYAYCGGNPIMLVDPNGENWIGALIGAAIGAYAGGVMSNGGQFNPGKWDWQNGSTIMGMFQGAISGAQLGSSIENSIFQKIHVNRTIKGGGDWGGFKTKYAQNAYLSNYKTPMFTLSDNAYEPKLTDAYYLYDPTGAHGFGHSADLTGNPELGYYYYSTEGYGRTPRRLYFRTYDEFLGSKDPQTGKLMYERYSKILRFKTSFDQDWDMIQFGDLNYNNPYSLTKFNCGDLTGRIFEAGGLKGYHEGWFTIPDQQYRIMRGF